VVKKKFYQFTLRVRKETYQYLKKNSVESGLSIAAVARAFLEKIQKIEGEVFCDGKTQNSIDPWVQEQLESFRPILFENNLLLRKIGRHINSQILLETDAQLEHHIRNKKGQAKQFEP